MDEAYKKSFDLASDVTKQLITLATAVIAAVATLANAEILKIEPKENAYVTVAILFFLFSIICGLWTLYAIAGTMASISRSRSHDISNKYTIYRGNIRWPALAQIVFFIFGMFCLVLFAN